MPDQPSAAAWQLVILAAGQGRRFGGDQPKMLAPVRGEQGLLELLLQALLEHHRWPAELIHVVGAEPALPALEQRLQRLNPNLQLHGLGAPGSQGPLHSLATALEAQQHGASRSRPCWVLHADTHYPRPLLQQLVAEPPATQPLVVLESADPTEVLEVGVALNATGQVEALGPGPGWHWRMLPAVAWPMVLYPELLDPNRRCWNQWQLLQELRASHPAQALISTESGVFDVDTVADHQRARERLQPQ